MRTISMILITAISILFCLEINGQNNYKVIANPSGQSLIPSQVFQLPNGKIILSISPYLSNADWTIYALDKHLTILNTYSNPNITIENVSHIGNTIVVFGNGLQNFPRGLRYVILLDSNLNEISNTNPIQKNWSRHFFANHSWNTEFIQGRPAYFGQFFNNATTEPDVHYGWLSLHPNGDTLEQLSMRLSKDTIAILSMFADSEEGFYSNGFTENVTRSWSTTIQSSIAFQHSDSLTIKNRTNTYLNSTFPNYPRVLASNSLRNILINEHSVYGVVNYETASPNLFSDLLRSFTIIKFEKDFSSAKTAHNLTIDNNALLRSSALQNLVFDHTKTNIYISVSSCTPSSMSFVDQDRTCALSIAKYDTALNLIWRKDIPMERTFLSAECLTPIDDGGVLIVAMRIDSTPNPNVRNVFIVKLDSAGNHSVSVPELAAEKPQVQLYPNPTSGSVHLHWQQGQYQRFGLFNLKGQQVYHSELHPGSNLHQLSLPNLPAGLYFYQLTGPSGTVSGKLVKN